MSDIKVDLCGIKLANPVLTAPGPNVRTSLQMLEAVKGGVGGIVSKTISTHPAKDIKPTITRTFYHGVMNCETWSEISYQDFLTDLEKVKKTGIPLIVSLGYSAQQLSILGEIIEKEIDPHGYEFSTHYVGKEIEPLKQIALSLKDKVDKPVFMKISPNSPNIANIAMHLSEIVDGFVAINSFGPVLDFDEETIDSPLSSEFGQGWLSGPPIMPLGLRIVYEIAGIQDKPIIGVGGISTGVDAVKYMMCGASAVGICSAALTHGPDIYGEVSRQIEQWLDQHRHTRLPDIYGLYAKKIKKRITGEYNPVINVNEQLCVGCGNCISKCPNHALAMNEQKNKAQVNLTSCIGCGFCRGFCPQQALTIKRRTGSD